MKITFHVVISLAIDGVFKPKVISSHHKIISSKVKKDTGIDLVKIYFEGEGFGSIQSSTTNIIAD